jgi:hypothetical protein
MLLEKKPDRSPTGLYFAIKKDKRWWVYFGRMSDDGNNFILGYSYVCPDGRYQEMIEIPNGEVDAGMLQFARAIKSAFSAIELKYRRYNPNVFREGDDTITVYIAPGNETEDLRLGGDHKITVSSDGAKVLNVKELHKTLLSFPPADKNKAASFHTHLLTDLPTETDVAAVLLNPSLAPHYVVAEKWITRIDKDGKISLVGKTEEILKDQKTESSATDVRGTK